MRRVRHFVDKYLTRPNSKVCYIFAVVYLFINGINTENSTKGHFRINPDTNTTELLDTNLIYNSTTEYPDLQGCNNNCSLCNTSHVICNSTALRTVPRDIIHCVKYLDLTGNEIQRLGGNAFTRLEFLEAIFLGYNNISYIHQNAFRNLYRLEILHLEGNKITDLDPSGLTFQHLVSLRSLFLQNNFITKINKFSFFTVAVKSMELFVDLEDNPVECDCNFWALKEWHHSTVLVTLDINMTCANGTELISYKDANVSDTGSCNSTTDGIFSKKADCSICINESTNYKCNEKGVTVSESTMMVCAKTVAWDASNKTMSINSRFYNYYECLSIEALNDESCGLGFQSTGNIACAFCCIGPTCTHNTIGGRTKDFILYLSYKRWKSSYPVLPSINNATLNELKSSISNFAGGLDLQVFEVTPQNSQHDTVIIQLYVTSFNTETVESVISSIMDDVIQAMNSTDGILGQEDPIDLSVTSYLEGIKCNPITDVCPANMTCSQGLDGETRCLCKDSFFQTSAKMCIPLNLLQVANLSVPYRSTDTVTLAWSADKHGTSVYYTIEASPNNGSLVEKSANGASWSGLAAGKLYNFTVTSVLESDFYRKSVESIITGVWTLFDHGMQCSLASGQCTSEMYCVNFSDTLRCLCGSSTFYVYSAKSCLPTSKLKVESITTLSSTTDTVVLTWKAKNYENNVTYQLSPSPHHGHAVENSVNSSGGSWSGLIPGTCYNFTVTSVLISEFYSRNVHSSISGVWTKAVHGNSCTPEALNNGNMCTGRNIECQHNYMNRNFCLCSSGYYFNPDKTCRNVNELRVRNLNVSSVTNDGIAVTWRADRHGTNVKYSIEPMPRKGQAVPGSVTVSGGKWLGLDPETMYNFTVTATLPADDFYPERNLTSSFIIWTKSANIVILSLRYITQNAAVESLMNQSSSSQEYINEARRITNGVRSVISNIVNLNDVQMSQIRQTPDHHYEVTVLIVMSTFDNDTQATEKEITYAVRKSLLNPNGFFFKEQMRSLNVSSNLKASYHCPYAITSVDKGALIWPASVVGVKYTICPNNNSTNDPLSLATRECLEISDGFYVWGEVNDTFCRSVRENPDLDELLKTNITTENARDVSSSLRSYTETLENVTVGLVNQAVQLLEKLVMMEMLAQPEVVQNVLSSVSNIIDIDPQMLEKSQTDTNASKRLLEIIDLVANTAQLHEGKLKVLTRNLAVAAVKMDSTGPEDIILVVHRDADHKQNGSLVNIDVSQGESTRPEGKTSIKIPSQAIVDSLTSQQKATLERISFAVHRSDKLFATLINNSGMDDQGMTGQKENDKMDGNNGSLTNDSLAVARRINSNVISASLPGIRVQNLRENISMSFKHINPNDTKPQCVFWMTDLPSSDDGSWSSMGCGVVQSFPDSTICGCNHLTNFALLMDVYRGGTTLSELDRKILSIISYVGCGISCFALLLTIITYSLFREITQYSMSDHTKPRRKLRRDKPAKILLNLCLALLLSNLVFLVGMQDYTFGNIAACKAVAVLLHYFLLSSLAWMAVEAFYMYLALVLVFKTYYTNFILKCSLFGWGVPLLVIVITLAVNATDNYGFINSGLCWLQNPAFYAAFVGPVCFILLINLLAFILVVKQLVGISSKRLHKADRNSTIQRLRGVVGVVILLGLSWIFAIFAIDQASVVFYYLFAIFNSLQGLFIFVFYCLLKTDALVSLKRSLPCFEEYGDSSKSYSNSRAAGHYLADHRSESSSSTGRTKNTVSSTADSRKDSCFSSADDLGIENGGFLTDTNVDAVNNKVLVKPLLRLHNIDNDLSSSNSPSWQSDNTLKKSELNLTHRNTTSETEYQLEKYNDLNCNTTNLPGQSSLLQTPTILSLPQNINPDYTEFQKPDPPHASGRTENLTLDYPTLNSSVAAESEIDYSHLPSVGEIREKFESAIHETPNSI